MTSNKFLDINGLKVLLSKIDSRYKNKRQTSIDAGLKFIDITSKLDKNGILTITDPDGYFHQGRYYYCSELVKEIKIGPYKADDSNIMGESKIYIVTASEIPNKTISHSNTDGQWIWFDNKSILESNSNILITICTNQNNLFLVDQKSYSSPYTPDQPQPDQPDQPENIGENSIKVTYNWDRGSSKNTPFNGEWLKQLSNCTVYYSPTGSGVETIGIDNLKEGLDVPKSTTNKPYIVIKFHNNSINFEKLLYDIDFENFYISLDSTKTITSIKSAFGAETEKTTSNISLGELTSDNCSFTSMESLFKNRNCANITFPSADKVTSIKYILKNNKLFTDTKNLNNISLKKCTDFEEAFCGCIGIKNVDFLNSDNWKCDRSFAELQCFQMFSGTSVKTIQAVYEWLAHQINQVPVVNLRGMFKDCKSLENVSHSASFNTPIVSSSIMNNKTIDMGYMFSGCDNLTSFPVLAIEDVLNLNCEYMFSNINGKSGKSFDAFKYWNLNTSNLNTLNKKISFESMFNNTSFDAFNETDFIFGCAHEDDKGSKFNLTSLIDKDLYNSKCGLIMTNMFNGTKSNKSYNLYLSIYTGLYDRNDNILEWDSSISAFATSGMFDVSNNGLNKIYTPAKGRKSKLYNLIEVNYSDIDWFYSDEIK